MSKYHSLTPDEIESRVERIERGSPIWRYMSAVFVGTIILIVGGLLTATGIGALLGIPMLIIGFLFGVYGVFGVVIRPFMSFLESSPWEDTSLERKSPENRRHRKVNKTFSGRCPVCGSFLSLRDTSDKTIPTALECDACGATLTQEKVDTSTNEWRLTGGDDDRIGERKSAEEWIDEQRERNVKDRNKSRGKTTSSEPR